MQCQWDTLEAGQQLEELMIGHGPYRNINQYITTAITIHDGAYDRNKQNHQIKPLAQYYWDDEDDNDLCNAYIVQCSVIVDRNNKPV